MDEHRTKLKPNPEQRANFISRIFFCFIGPFLRIGFKRPLEIDDLYEVLPPDQSDVLCQRLERAWDAELASAKTANRKPQLRKAVVSAFGKKFMLLGLVTLFEEMIKIAQPIFMGGLIRYFRYSDKVGSRVTQSEAYFHAGGLTFCAIILAVAHHPYFYSLQRIGMRIRIACSGLIYKKSLSLSSIGLRQASVAKIVNILSNDVSRMDQAVLFVHYLWAAPIALVGFIILLWFTMGPSCLAGFFCLVLLVPLQGAIGRQMGQYRRKVAVLADKRISIMNEILNGIRVIKMYAWEKPFAQLVDKARMDEIKKLRVHAFFQALIMGLFYVSGKIIVLFAIVAYIFSGQAITAEVIFVASALFNTARLTTTLFLPFAIQFIFESRVTFGRMEEILLLEDKNLLALPAPPASARPVGADDHLPYIDDEKARSTVTLNSAGNAKNNVNAAPVKKAKTDGGNEVYAEMVDFSAKWDEEQTGLILDKISFTAKPGQLVVIVGPVGAGKSSILLSLLGEMKQVEGRMRLQGSVAYVPQQAWIFSATLRKNVTFGMDNIDMARYSQALNVCALRKDLDLMPLGDMTIVGDKGVLLSGGQRARVNLARAVYSDADIYLLDDPLSAVDSAVGQYLFKKCIASHLKNKPRILVTHQLQYLKSADHILVVKGGKIVASGTFEQLQKLGDEFTAILKECEESYNRRESVSSPQSSKSPLTTSNGSRQNSVDSPARQPATSSPKSNADGVPKFEFRTPATPEGGRKNESGSDVHDLDWSSPDMGDKKSPAKRPSGDRSKATEEKERLLHESGADLDKLKLANKLADDDSLTASAWSLVAVEATAPPQEEDRTSGSVSWRVYYEYFKAMANCFVVVLLLLFFFLVQALFNFTDWWLNIWSTKAEKEHERREKAKTDAAKLQNTNSTTDETTTIVSTTDNTEPMIFGLSFSVEDGLKIYAALTMALLVFSMVRSILFRHMLTRSSFHLHSRMFRAIIRTPLTFFDKNPIGRILNRFSKDTGTMDELLGFVTFDFVQGLISFFGIILVICLLNPWVFIPTAPLLVAFVLVRYYYMKTARAVKRMEATTRSPIFSHVSATLNGLTTIRAFKAEPQVLADFYHYQNTHTAAFSVFLSTSRWFAVFIDWLCGIFVGVVAFMSVLTSNNELPNGGAVGLSLFYAVSLMGFFQWIIRQSTEMESMMVCVERILEYSRLPPEKLIESAGNLPERWPEKGEIVFRAVSLKYGDEGAVVLRDLNFTIKPTEKIGIVGRTGAGKSSLLNALFRLAEPEGAILIDGRDISSVGLQDLRKRISIIPQDPVLFIGTFRENLDPFNEFTDPQIWTALEQVELKNIVAAYTAKLDTPMQEGGANLSVGQRQLVCLARALLRHNKVLVIDEATANVDVHTDASIQRTLRIQFKDCTVLTIAHRLNTIMDADRVMLMQEGRLMEFDSPAALLRGESSLFGKLVQETGLENAKLLTSLAMEAEAARKKASA